MIWSFHLARLQISISRFVTAKESGASEVAKRAIIDAGFDSTIKSLIWTGRPLRSLNTPYVKNWETVRRTEMEGLLAKGIIPLYHGQFLSSFYTLGVLRVNEFDRDGSSREDQWDH